LKWPAGKKKGIGKGNHHYWEIGKLLREEDWGDLKVIRVPKQVRDIQQKNCDGRSVRLGCREGEGNW
jgi:hypothetical protein